MKRDADHILLPV